VSPAIRLAGSVARGLARSILHLFLAPPPKNDGDVVPAQVSLYSTLDRRDSEKAA
jgi:hypothetical protein